MATYLKKLDATLHRDMIDHPLSTPPRGTSYAAWISSFCTGKRMPQEMVIEVLEERSIRFTDVGMGVQLNDHLLGGVVRVTTTTPQVRDHFLSRVSFEDAAGNDEGMDSDFP